MGSTLSIVSNIDVGNINDAPTFIAPTPAEGDELAP